MTCIFLANGESITKFKVCTNEGHSWPMGNYDMYFVDESAKISHMAKVHVSSNAGSIHLHKPYL